MLEVPKPARRLFSLRKTYSQFSQNKLIVRQLKRKNQRERNLITVQNKLMLRTSSAEGTPQKFPKAEFTIVHSRHRRKTICGNKIHKRGPHIKRKNTRFSDLYNNPISIE